MVRKNITGTISISPYSTEYLIYLSCILSALFSLSCIVDSTYLILSFLPVNVIHYIVKMRNRTVCLMINNVENEFASSLREQMHYLMFYSNCNIKNRKTMLMFRFRPNTWYMYFPFYKMPINYHADVNYKRPTYIP